MGSSKNLLSNLVFSKHMYAESFWRLVTRPNVFSGFFTGTANNVSDNKATFAVKLQVYFEIGSVEIIDEPFSKNLIFFLK